MENKYYKPTIEEFHVGFIYEALSVGKDEEDAAFIFADTGDNVWNEYKFPDPFLGYNLKKMFSLEDYKLRVKYLDEEDITSLGFEWCSECDNFSIYSSKDFIEAGIKKYLRITHYEEKNTCHIETLESDRLGRYSTKFDGVIKNKSELKRILNQIGYGK